MTTSSCVLFGAIATADGENLTVEFRLYDLINREFLSGFRFYSKTNDLKTIIHNNITKYTPPRNSLLLHSHGVEHLPEWEFKYSAFPKWQERYTGLILMAPWGRWDQPAGGNIFEEHKWQIYEEDFKDLGLATYTYGPKDEFGEIVGVWVDK